MALPWEAGNTCVHQSILAASRDTSYLPAPVSSPVFMVHSVAYSYYSNPYFFISEMWPSHCRMSSGSPGSGRCAQLRGIMEYHDFIRFLKHLLDKGMFRQESPCHLNFHHYKTKSIIWKLFLFVQAESRGEECRDPQTTSSPLPLH